MARLHAVIKQPGEAKVRNPQYDTESEDDITKVTKAVVAIQAESQAEPQADSFQVDEWDEYAISQFDCVTSTAESRPESKTGSKTESRPEFTLESKPESNPFSTIESKAPSKASSYSLSPDRKHDLKSFLISDEYLWNNPEMFRLFDDHAETQIQYEKKRQQEMNKGTPKILELILSFIPRIVRRPGSCTDVISTLSDTHKDTLGDIANLFQRKDSKFNANFWNGIYVLLPMPYMETFNYGYNATEAEVRSNVLEFHRRALNLEYVVSILTSYLFVVIDKAASNDINLKQISVKNQSDACQVLTAMCEYSKEKNMFWSKAWFDNEADIKRMDCLTKLATAQTAAQTATQSGITETGIMPTFKWLNENREAAFTRHYMVCSELDWGMPILALLLSMDLSMARLSHSRSAQEVKETINEYLKERVAVYLEDLKPLAKYGGVLTR